LAKLTKENRVHQIYVQIRDVGRRNAFLERVVATPRSDFRILDSIGETAVIEINEPEFAVGSDRLPYLDVLTRVVLEWEEMAEKEYGAVIALGY
jgi:hypothetical protein